MTARQAIGIVLSFVRKEPVIAATGFIARSAQSFGDRPENFYVIGSMGMASSIATGLALARPAKKVIALDGDGAVLMNLGALPTAAALKLSNFVHIVIDNASYESTGAQETLTGTVRLEAIAKASGYRYAKRVVTPAALKKEMPAVLKQDGPSFLLVRVSNDSTSAAPRIEASPEELTRRFVECLR